MQQTTSNSTTLTIGIDLGDSESAYCVLSPEGEVVEESNLVTTPEGLDEFLKGRPRCRIVIEACLHSHWVGRQLEAAGHEVVVTNPRRNALIAKSIRKNDRSDAHLLAEMGRSSLSLLHPVCIRDEQTLAVRSLLRARRTLVRTRARLVCMVRSQCKLFALPLPSCGVEVFVKRARQHIPEILQGILTPVLDMIDSLQEQIRAYNKRIDALGKETYPVTQLLRQVPGVGEQLSLAYVVALGSPKRFKNSRDVGAYLGLVPKQRQSGSKDPQLSISKQGDREVRTLLVNAAAYIMRRTSPDTTLKRFGKRIAARGGARDRARARVAVARKLAVILHRLWTTSEVYEPLRGATA